MGLFLAGPRIGLYQSVSQVVGGIPKINTEEGLGLKRLLYNCVYFGIYIILLFTTFDILSKLFARN